MAWKGSSPTINTYHNYTRNIKTNTTRHDRVGWRQVECTRWKFFSVLVLENERLIGTMERERNWHEGHKTSKYPNDGDRCHSNFPCHPASISKVGLRHKVLISVRFVVCILCFTLMLTNVKEINKSSTIIPQICRAGSMRLKLLRLFECLRHRNDKVINFLITLMDLLCECIDPMKWHIN